MALSDSVVFSLKEAESHMRNALAYAARQERPIACQGIAQILLEIEQLQTFDGLLDHLDELKLEDEQQ
jgi:hypothetical protein